MIFTKIKKKTMAKHTCFSTKEGRELALRLAKHISETEEFQNWDELINEFRLMLCEIGDKRAGAPVSEFFLAEDLEHIVENRRERRYSVKIRREKCLF